MKITKDLLLENGWEEDDSFKDVGLIQYKKTITRFHYTIMYFGLEKNNWYEWNLHIDNPDFESVGSLEIENMEDIETVSKIYV